MQKEKPKIIDKHDNVIVVSFDRKINNVKAYGVHEDERKTSYGAVR